jgi:integrase
VAILAECPYCRRKQSIRNKICKKCGSNLDQAKKSQKVNYWISYYIGNKQRREKIGYSITEAKDEEGKRRGQKRDGKLLNIDRKMTFNDLIAWYLELTKVKELKSYSTIKTYLKKFNEEFGSKQIATIKLINLEDLQEKRKVQGLKAKTIDDEMNYTKSMIIKAWDNDLIGGEVVKAFKRLKPMLKRHTNKRDRILTVAEYQKLYDVADRHIKKILAVGYWTGMRKGEILNLTWDRVDLKNRLISLQAKDTKEGKAKNIPIGPKLHKVMKKIPRALHSQHVILFNGKRIKRHFTAALKKACDKAGIQWGREVQGGFIFHDIRHSFVTDMRKAGVEKSVRAAITGHSLVDMDDRYNVVDEKDKMNAIKALESYRDSETIDHFIDHENINN